MPIQVLCKLIELYYPVTGCGPYPLEPMLRLYLMRDQVAVSDPAIELAAYAIKSLTGLARMGVNEPIPDATSILNLHGVR